MPSGAKESLDLTYRTDTSFLESKGMTLKLVTLVNETSEILLISLESSNIDINLAPPYLHRRNTVERAVQTFKAYFISILCGTYSKFTVNLWDKLLLQAEITLNLLLNSRISPVLSTYCQVWGNFNFNKSPLVPVGTKLLVRLKPEIQKLGLQAPPKYVISVQQCAIISVIVYGYSKQKQNVLSILSPGSLHMSPYQPHHRLQRYFWLHIT